MIDHQNAILNLPQELLYHIFSKLENSKDYCNASLVCKLFHQILNDKHLVCQLFPTVADKVQFLADERPIKRTMIKVSIEKKIKEKHKNVKDTATRIRKSSQSCAQNISICFMMSLIAPFMLIIVLLPARENHSNHLQCTNEMQNWQQICLKSSDREDIQALYVLGVMILILSTMGLVIGATENYKSFFNKITSLVSSGIECIERIKNYTRLKWQNIPLD